MPAAASRLATPLARLRALVVRLDAGALGGDGRWLAEVLGRVLDAGQSFDIAAGLPVRWRDRARRQARDEALRRAHSLLGNPSLTKAARRIAAEAASAARSHGRAADDPVGAAVAEALQHGEVPRHRRLVAILGRAI
ncbi:MAG: hypothetical protein WD673_15235 [Alphaproteobacteria bacterium]